MDKLTEKQKQIFDIADKLFTESGVKPSVRQIREEMGGGSNSTINEAMKLWRAQHTGETVVSEDAPDVVLRAVIEASKPIWAAAKETANRSVQEAKESARLLVQDAELERDETFAQLDEAEARIAELEKESEAQAAEIKQLKGNKTKMEKQIGVGQKLQGKYEQLQEDHADLLAKLEAPEAEGEK